MNIIKRVILFIYNFIFVQYYPKCDLKIHKNINKEPVIMINGMYNMQISEDCIMSQMDIFNTTYIFNLLPAMNARMNAQFLYNKIYGGFIEIGKFSEYTEGVYCEWSEKNPISFFCHSYGGNVLLELINILLEKGLEPEKMIYKVVFLNPTFISTKTNYREYNNQLLDYYVKTCKQVIKYPLLKFIYNPRDIILKKNKLLCFGIPILKMYQINKKNVFDTSDLDYNPSHIDFLNDHKITYKIYVGSITFDFEYIFYNILCSPLYIFSSIKLDIPKINVFDGMNYYDLKFCQKNNIQIIDSLGHFDLFFDVNPFSFARTKLFSYEILKYLRNKKNVNK